MVSSSITSAVSTRHRELPPAESRFDRRLGKILRHATAVFYEKGYEGASMRDLARSSGMSLSGLYYYFESKEKLLYLIQKHTFSTIVERLRERLDQVSDPEERIRVFILNHLEYFLANEKAMKVLSHEAEVLTNGYGGEIAAIKREYYRICVGLLDDFKLAKRLDFSSRMAVLSLFGMMNWIYTWYNPRVDANAEELARGMGDILLRGISASANGHRSNTRKSQKRRAASN
jgi:TetR/AcrR family transcriptional regulator, cholesterol catabolism regulator